jgi:penicillin-binding protein 1A
MLDDAPSSEPSPTPGHAGDGEGAGRGRVTAVVLRVLKWLFILTVMAGLGAAVTLWQVLKRYEADLPSTDELKNYHPPQVTRVLARDGTLLAELFTERRTVVGIDAIPDTMKVSVLAAEDADFYQHEGLDYLGMLRALVVNLRSHDTRQGGSTITQQVVKNVLLTPERTFERKAREVLLAWRIEQELSKDEILELYLNHIYFGHGRYGVEEASRYYFGKSVGDLSLAEAAMLAGLAKGPSIYSPRIDIARALRRRDQVLDQLEAKGFATPAAVEQAKASPILLAPATESLPELAPEVIAEAQRVLKEVVGAEAPRGGFTITTTIDPAAQASARKALRANLDEYAKRHNLLAPIGLAHGEPPKPPKKKGAPAPKAASPKAEPPFQGTPSDKHHGIYVAVVTGADDAAGLLKVRVGTADGVVHLRESPRYNPKGLPPSRFATAGALVRVSAVHERGVGLDGVPHEYRLELGPQGALVAIDTATREIRALIGSYEAVRGGLDRTTRAHRQPGSTFKPFVYSHAIQSRRFTAASPLGALTPDGKPPSLLLRDALALSDNNAVVWTLGQLGAESVVTHARALGIESPMQPTESLALGAYEVTPLELATAYSTFATGGIYEEPILVTRIVGPDGAELDLGPTKPRRRVLEESEAYLMTSLLTTVVQRGTGKKAAALKLPIAGKTGTSNDAKDAWFAGYSPDIVCVVWTGFDDAKPLGAGESGATAALPAWMSFMGDFHKVHRPSAFKRPADVVEIAVDPASGLLPYEDEDKTINEVFLAGSEPKEKVEPPLLEDPYEGDDAPNPPNATAQVDPPPPAQPHEPPPF